MGGPALTRAAPSPTGGLRRGFGWNFAGSIAYNASQWVLLVLLARATDQETVGTFALLLAITAPVFLTCGLNLRMVRATDVSGRWAPRQYQRLRVVLNVVSFCISLGIGAAFGLAGAAALALVFICLSKSSEATSQLLYGHFQLEERLDLVARSMLLRSVAGPAGFLGGLFVGSLPVACAGLAVGWFVVYALHDAPASSRLASGGRPRRGTDSLRSLARTAAPLGASAGLGSLTTNVPRFAVQLWLGTAALGGFAALAYLAQIVSLVTGTLGDTVIGRLARLHHSEDTKGMWRVARIVLFFGVAVTIISTLGAWLVGAPVIGALMGTQYVDQPTLIVLMIGAGFITFQRSLARVLHAGQKFTQVLLVDVSILAIATGSAYVLVPRLEETGAAAVLGVAFFAGTLVTSLLLTATRTRSADRGSPT